MFLDLAPTCGVGKWSALLPLRPFTPYVSWQRGWSTCLWSGGLFPHAPPEGPVPYLRDSRLTVKITTVGYISEAFFGTRLRVSI